MSKFIQIKLMIFLALMVLSLSSSAAAENLLSRLLKRAQNSNRPLIVILDNSYLKEKAQRPPQHHQSANPLLTSSEEGHHNRELILAPNFFQDQGLQHKKRPRVTTKSPLIKKPKSPKKKFYRAREFYDKTYPRSPIVKSLLRISNDLRCDAKDECADICREKFNGKRKKTCIVKCEVTYECKVVSQEKDDSCNGDECDDSCASTDCDEEAGSTKGYKISGEDNCKKGRC